MVVDCTEGGRSGGSGLGEMVLGETTGVCTTCKAGMLTPNTCSSTTTGADAGSERFRNLESPLVRRRAERLFSGGADAEEV